MRYCEVVRTKHLFRPTSPKVNVAATFFPRGEGTFPSLRFGNGMVCANLKCFEKRRGAHCVKSNIVNNLCKDMVYTLVLRFYAFESRTERSGERLSNAARDQSRQIFRWINLPVCTSNSAIAKFL